MLTRYLIASLNIESKGMNYIKVIYMPVEKQHNGSVGHESIRLSLTQGIF